MLDIDFPEEEQILTPYYFIGYEPIVVADFTPLHVTFRNQVNGEEVSLDLQGEYDGENYYHSLPPYDTMLLLRDLVSEPPGIMDIPVEVDVAVSAGGKSFSYRFVREKYEDPEVGHFLQGGRTLSEAHGLTRHVYPSYRNFGGYFYFCTEVGSTFDCTMEYVYCSADGSQLKKFVYTNSSKASRSVVRVTVELGRFRQQAPAGSALREVLLHAQGRTERIVVERRGEVPVAVVKFRNRFLLEEYFSFFGGLEEKLEVKRSEAAVGLDKVVYDTQEEQRITLRTGPMQEAEQCLFLDLVSSPEIYLDSYDGHLAGRRFVITDHELKRSSDPYALPEESVTLKPIHGGPMRLPVTTDAYGRRLFDSTFPQTFE